MWSQRLSKLKSIWSIISGILIIAPWLGKWLYKLIDFASNVDFLIQSYPKLKPVVDIAKSTSTHLVVTVIGLFWLAYLIVRPEKPTSKIPEEKGQLVLALDDNDPNYFWESPLFRGQLTTRGHLEMLADRTKDRSVSRGCRVKVVNVSTKESARNVRVLLQEINPCPKELKLLPLPLRFTDNNQQTIDLDPREPKFVDVIYWKFPETKKGEQWPPKFYLCGVREDIPIDARDYQMKVVAYGTNRYAEKAVSVGMRDKDGKEKIWMWSS